MRPDDAPNLASPDANLPLSQPGELEHSTADTQLLAAAAKWLSDASSVERVQDSSANITEFVVVDSPDGTRHYNIQAFQNAGDVAELPSYSRSVIIRWLDTQAETSGEVIYNGWNGFSRFTAVDSVDTTYMDYWLKQGGVLAKPFDNVILSEDEIISIAADVHSGHLNSQLTRAAATRLHPEQSPKIQQDSRWYKRLGARILDFLSR